MPDCPRCGRPMATVLKRERGVVRTTNECSYCADPDPCDQPNPSAPLDQEGESDVRR